MENITQKGITNIKISLEERLFYFATVITVIWQYFSFINTVSFLGNSIVSFGILGFWAFSCFFLFTSKRQFKKMFFTVLPALIVLIITLLKYVLRTGEDAGDGYFAPSKPFYLTYTMCYGFVFAYAVQLLDIKLRIKLLRVIIFILTITPLPSIFYVLQDSNAIRNSLDKWAIIDFDYIYSNIPMIGMLIITFKFGKGKAIPKWQILICIITNSIVILLSNFTTAIIIMLGTIFISVLFTKKTTIYKLLFIVLIIGICFLILKKQISELIIVFSKANIFNDVMKKRLEDLASFIVGEEFSSSLGGRFDLMEASWNTFLKYPILGIPYQLIERSTVGFHETWVSVLAYSGIIGFGLTVWGFINIYRFIISHINNKISKQGFLFCSVILLVLSFLNPMIIKSTLMMLLGIIPLTDCLFVNQNKGEILSDKLNYREI